MSIEILHTEIRDDIEWAVVYVRDVPAGVLRSAGANVSDGHPSAMIKLYPFNKGSNHYTGNNICRVKLADLPGFSTRTGERVVCSCGKSIHPKLSGLAGVKHEH